MSFFVTPFEVSSRGLSEPAQCRFVHIFPGIATRHSDTIDSVFRVNGHPVLVAIPCATLNELRDREQNYLTDQQLAEIAALFLKRTLENGYDPTQAELVLGETELRTLARELGYL
jgi:hypothetical protein